MTNKLTPEDKEYIEKIVAFEHPDEQKLKQRLQIREQSPEIPSRTGIYGRSVGTTTESLFHPAANERNTQLKRKVSEIEHFRRELESNWPTVGNEKRDEYDKRFAEREAEKLKENDLWNKPHVREVDHEHFARLDTWTDDQFIFLLLERNPDRLTLKELYNLKYIKSAPKEFWQYLQYVKNSIQSNTLSKTGNPFEFIQWAESKELVIPEKLKEAVIKFHSRTPNSISEDSTYIMESFKELQQKNIDLETEIVTLKQENDALKLQHESTLNELNDLKEKIDEGKELDYRERESWAQIVIGFCNEHEYDLSNHSKVADNFENFASKYFPPKILRTRSRIQERFRQAKEFMGKYDAERKKIEEKKQQDKDEIQNAVNNAVKSFKS